MADEIELTPEEATAPEPTVTIPQAQLETLENEIKEYKDKYLRSWQRWRIYANE